MENDLITPAEAARMRGVTRSAITDLMRRGRLRIIEVGGRPFLSRAEVERFTPEITGRPRTRPASEKRATAKASASKGTATKRRTRKAA